MKVTIFGGTGRTGRLLVERALENGHEVCLLARNPASLGFQDERLTVIQGDLQDAERVRQAIIGAEAVISVLGPTHNQPTFEVSAGMRNIVDVMRQNEVRRLIVTAGAGVSDLHDQPGLFDKLIGRLLKLSAPNVLADMEKAVEIVRRSALDWTVVRVPMLVDGPATGKVQIGYLGKGIGLRIRRADLANFLLLQLDEKDFLRRAPVVSN